MEVRENGPSKMPPATAFDRILVARRFACPTNWWASGFLLNLTQEKLWCLNISLLSIVLYFTVERNAKYQLLGTYYLE